MAAHSTIGLDPTSDIEEEARRAARKRAIDRLAEELQHPEQLVKVGSRHFLGVEDHNNWTEAITKLFCEFCI